MNLIHAALSCKLPTPEKLLLVYLASRASIQGVGLWPEVSRVVEDLDTSDRSFQRWVSSLRAAGVLRMCGSWYVLFPELFPGVTEQQLEQLTGLQFGLPVMAPEPPRDPVKDSKLYRTLVEAGIFDEAECYRLAKLDLDAGPDTTATLKPAADHSEAREDANFRRTQVPLVEPVTIAAGLDEAGRFDRVLDILEPNGLIDADHSMAWTLWCSLVNYENKNTVKGECDAFELLYPAIVKAALRVAGTMSLLEFLDLDAITQMRAPWDFKPVAVGAGQRMAMQSEIASMLRELEASGNANCQVQPLTQEKGDDGVMRFETLESYYRRVKAKHGQMLKLKDMGAL